MEALRIGHRARGYAVHCRAGAKRERKGRDMRMVERTDEGLARRGRRRSPSWRSCRAASTTARSRCASRTGRSSRSRAPATRRCCSASPAHLRPGYDWFFPYYRDRALVLGARRHAARDAAAGGRRRRRSRVGRAADAVPLGRRASCNIVSQTSCTGSQCLPAVGCAEAARYIGRRPDLPGCTAYGDELTYVSLGEGATSEGEFWESLNTACRLHLPVLYVVADNGYAISVRSTDQAPGADLARWCAASAGCTS